MIEAVLLIKLVILVTGTSYLLSRFKPRGSFGFGSSGSGGGTQTSTSTTTQELSPQQQQLLGLVIPEATRFVQNPPTQFPGSAIAPFNPLQEQAQQAAVQTATDFLPGQLQNAFNASNFLLGPSLSPESNPALQRATEAAIRPITQAFETNVLPNIRSNAITAGGFGGSRQGVAEGLASESALRAIGDTSANVQNQAYQQGLQAMVQALSLQPQLATSAFLPSTALGGVGTQLQQMSQAQLSEAANRYLTEQILPFSAAQEVASLAFGLPGGTASTTGTGTASGGSTGPSPLDFALAGLGLIGGFGFPCWVAREVYGVDNPQWLKFRSWLFDDAPRWLRILYLRYGERFAKVVARHQWLKPALRYLMDKAIESKENMQWQSDFQAGKGSTP